MYKHAEFWRKYHRRTGFDSDTVSEVTRAMKRNRILIAILMVLLLHNETIVSLADPTIYRFLSEVLQYNVIGLPNAHKKTEWDFDPEVGKQRRIRYEQENGRFGEYAITKLGMGIGYKGPRGTPVKS